MSYLIVTWNSFGKTIRPVCRCCSPNGSRCISLVPPRRRSYDGVGGASRSWWSVSKWRLRHRREGARPVTGNM